MKKQIVYTIAFLFALSFISAASLGANAQGQANLDTIAGLNSNAQVNATVESRGMQEGTPSNMAVEVQGEGKIARLISGNVSVNCSGECNLTKERVENRMVVRATLSNGKKAEIKVMPEVAAQRAMTRLQLNSCEQENCTIELKEVGTGNSTKIAYSVQAKKEVKILGLFNSKANVETQVDAETGEVIKIKKPWWVSMKLE